MKDIIEIQKETMNWLMDWYQANPQEPEKELVRPAPVQAEDLYNALREEAKK